MMEENVTREEILELYAKGGRNFRNTHALYIDLSNTILEGMYFKNLNFYGSNFSHTNLRNTAWEWVNLNKSNLSYADFTGADLYEVGFFGANLEGTIFKDVSFYHVGMIYEDYKSLPESLKLKNWNDDYNERLNKIGYFLNNVTSEKEEKSLEYISRKDYVELSVDENGKAYILMFRKPENIKYEDVSFDKMFEILENEAKNKNKNINKDSLYFKLLM